ncbi:MAG: bifunctional glycosyltransferase family 2/GtrA family protein [Lachnospiraceae bacterium]|nr:bifunctional glycosyltransferase family 2/GtrA family protein [Lachnospiraceae bacterium]
MPVDITQTAILIPSLNPDEKMIRLIENLKNGGFCHIICVDDGSGSEYGHYFEEAEKLGCDVLRHCVNMGKGRGIKTGLNYIRLNYPDSPGVVTVDSDGQHSVEDTIKCAQAMIDNPGSVIFGCRNFKEEGVPFKSYYGNTITRAVMKMFCGISLSDTQTGLRAIPQDLIETFVTTKGERYEYEMQQILLCKEKDIPITEVPIKTIYIEENKGSHFNPLTDSIRIYAQFSRFIFASVSSFLVDIILFALFVKLFIIPFGEGERYILISTIAARVISAAWNFMVNRMAVFKARTGIIKNAAKYAVLAVCQLALSALFVTMIFRLTHINETVIKVIVDSILFLISFQIQREVVFK